jgi:hypothetical protein
MDDPARKEARTQQNIIKKGLRSNHYIYRRNPGLAIFSVTASSFPPRLPEADQPVAVHSPQFDADEMN